MSFLPAVSITLDPKCARVLRLRRKEVAGPKSLRVEIVLRTAAGHPNLRIAQDLGVSRNTVKLWRRRFAEEGLKGLESRPIPGRPRKDKSKPPPHRREFAAKT